MKSELTKQVDKVLSEVITIRHALHQHPEIAMQEVWTSGMIRKRLKKNGISTLKPFLGTDVVAMIHGRKPGRNVTLRADIDALPILEQTGVPYQSETPGMMHACGHDGHTAMLIGAGLVLNALKNTFDGSVRLVFQPGEEIRAAGKDLVEKGALKNPAPDAIFALHGFDALPVGVIASKPGAFLAAAEFFTVKVQGKGAHGAMPDKAIDPILIGARIVEGLQAIPSRLTPPLDPVVLSVCRFTAGVNGNIIPDTAELEGTVRYLNPELGRRIPKQIERIVKGVCDSLGASYELRYDRLYIPTINDAGMVALGERVAMEHLGADAWQTLTASSMGGEDFAYYLLNHPGAMFRLGLGMDSAPLHSPMFNFNDKAARNGITFMAAAALTALNQP